MESYDSEYSAAGGYGARRPDYTTRDGVQTALDEARAKWDHADAPYQPTVLSLIRAAEAMFAALYPDGGKWQYFVTFNSQGRAGNGQFDITEPISSIDQVHQIEKYLRESGYAEAIVCGWKLFRGPDGPVL